MNACPPERFDGVDVPDTRDDSLIQERLLDRDAPAGNAGAERRGIQRWVGRVGSQRRDGRLTRGRHREPAERAAVLEDDASAVLEVEEGTREFRQRLPDPADDPVPIEPEVRDEMRASLDADQLVLPDARHADDPPANDTTDGRGRQPAADRGMQRAQRDDAAPDRDRFEPPRGLLDFRKLGHCFSLPARTPSRR